MIKKMKEIMEQIEALRQKPQSVENEINLAKLQWTYKEFRAEYERLVAKQANFLFSTYLQNGSARIPLTSRTRWSDPYCNKPVIDYLEVAPHQTSSPVYNIWNLRGECERLAEIYIENRYSN